jgi:hypothetical protein
LGNLKSRLRHANAGIRAALESPLRPCNIRSMRCRWLATVLMLDPTQTVFAAGSSLDYLPVAEKVSIRSETIREASGLAVSSRNDGFLWIVNDSGSTPALHLIEAGGKDRGQVVLTNARNVDWEDLASFSMDGTPWLLVADTGDNDSKRETSTLYLLSEPELPADGKALDENARIAWRIDFRYEGGPRDCESVAVDVPRGKILLLSKRTNPPEIHELPLHPPDPNRVLTTRRIGQVTVAAPADSAIPFRDQPTGLDIAPDNSLAAVVTYYGVFLFPRRPGESWPEAFARKSVALSPHCLAQAESVAFSKDGKMIHVVSEGRDSPIIRYHRNP